METYVTTASYRAQKLAEYQGNPLIEALPEIWSTREVLDLLSCEMPYHAGERELDAAYRLHCVQRLFRYFQPLKEHLDIERRISACIRQGYLGRNPLSAEHTKTLVSGHEAVMQGLGPRGIQTFRPQGIGFTIIGMSGIGKTTAIERILRLYPQCIVHTRYDQTTLMMTQIVWIKLDCPHDGSIKGLCLSFFDAVDNVTGANYSAEYSKHRYTIDMMMTIMAHVVNLHGIGLIVIDEIQHLDASKGGGSDKMLNFFVTLVNTIGIPLILIGTNKARHILQREFRQARRGSGQGDLLWDRMQKDTTWRSFVGSMWQHQWTRNSVRLTEGLSDVLYDESQGIIDLAVKLYAMVQIKAVASGAETFAENDVREAAREKLKLVQPMLEALRSGDERQISAYGDIAPVSIDDYVSAYTTAANVKDTSVYAKDPGVLESAVLKLMELEINPVEAKTLASDVLASFPEMTTAHVVQEAFRRWIGGRTTSSPDSEECDLRAQKNGNGIKKAGHMDTGKW